MTTRYTPNPAHLYRDTEDGRIINEMELFEQFQSMDEDNRNGRTFYQFILDCLSKNGFLEEVTEG